MDVAQACSRGPSCSDLVRATGRCGRRLGADQRAGVDRTRCPGCPCGRGNSGDLPATTRCWASARPGMHTVRRRRSVECSGCRRSTGYDCARPVHCRPGAGCRRIWADPAADQPQHLPDTEDPDVEGLLSSGQVDANRLVMRPGFACVVVPEPAPRLRHTVLSTTALARRCAERWWARTLARVKGPNWPSATTPPRRRCNTLTAAPCEPCTRGVFRYGVRGLPAAVVGVDAGARPCRLVAREDIIDHRVVACGTLGPRRDPVRLNVHPDHRDP